MSKGSAALTPQSSTCGEAPIREFANSNLAPGQSRQRVAPLLTGKEFLRNVLSLTQEDQTKFIDKVDQVRRDGLILLSASTL